MSRSSPAPGDLRRRLEVDTHTERSILIVMSDGMYLSVYRYFTAFNSHPLGLYWVWLSLTINFYFLISIKIIFMADIKYPTYIDICWMMPVPNWSSSGEDGLSRMVDVLLLRALCNTLLFIIVFVRQRPDNRQTSNLLCVGKACFHSSGSQLGHQTVPTPSNKQTGTKKKIFLVEEHWLGTCQSLNFLRWLARENHFRTARRSL